MPDAPISAHAAATQLYNEILDGLQNPDAHRPIPTRFTDLDKAIGGLDIPSYVAIGGREKQGKSTIAFEFAWILATFALRPQKVLFCTLEETVLGGLASRTIVRNTSDVTRTNLRMFNLHPLDQAKADIEASLTFAKEANLYFTDYIFNYRDMVSTAREIGATVIVADYLQLLEADLSTNNNITRAERIGSISRQMQLATMPKNGLPGLTTIAIYQLNDEGKAEGSRAIYKDASLVLEVNKKPDPVLSGGIDSVLEVVVRRHRNSPGEGSSFMLGMSGAHSRLSNLVTLRLDKVTL